MDPRVWDLHQLLAAYEAAVRRGAKDDAAWQRMRTELYAEPADVRRSRMRDRKGGRKAPPQGGMTLASVEAMVARMEAADASYG